jgi:chromosome segregation ATPase
MTEDLTLQMQKLEEENKKLKKRAEEAEGENTIIKGIGNNSPEMRALQAKVNELESTLSSAQDINDNHQRYNGKLQTRLTEVEADNKILSKQISDHIKNKEDLIRNAGLQ